MTNIYYTRISMHTPELWNEKKVLNRLAIYIIFPKIELETPHTGTQTENYIIYLFSL